MIASKNRKMKEQIIFTEPHLLSDMKSDTPILLALSGGADSRTLLEMLLKYCASYNAPLSVAHVNHMIRGQDADCDSVFCQKLAEKYSLPFYLLKADVPALAKKHGRSLEDEARKVRYDFFADVMQKNSIPILATAHNATDNAETVLFNLVRGSGIKGLCGIPPVRDFCGGKIIRPLLKTSKAEILKYCTKNALEYVTDVTNDDVEYSRNRIRNNILPQLEKINASAIANISRASELIRADDGFIDRKAKEFIEKQNGDNSIDLTSYNRLDDALRSRIAAIVLGNFFDTHSTHIKDFKILAERAVPHSELHFPQNTCVKVENGKILIELRQKSISHANFDQQIFFGETVIRTPDMTVLAQKCENTKNSEENHIRLKNIYKKSTTTLISFDTINDGLFIRPRQDGDKILCYGMHKKLKKLFNEKKIPLDMRSKLPVFYDSKGLVWIPSVALRDGENKSEQKIEITLFYN